MDYANKQALASLKSRFEEAEKLGFKEYEKEHLKRARAKNPGPSHYKVKPVKKSQPSISVPR